MSSEPSKKKKRGRKPAQDDDDTDGAITKDGEMPKKAFYRARAHVNPLSHNNAFAYPVSADELDWRTLFPNHAVGEDNLLMPSIVDVGCGFGGLTVALAKLYPDECSLGMEIRAKVVAGCFLFPCHMIARENKTVLLSLLQNKKPA
jgi:tRNA (guanine-N7-)-methyltransferase